MKLFILGPGSSLNHHIEEIKKASITEKLLAFQNVFPNCVDHFDVVPDYWVSGDPNAYMQGFRYLMNTTDKRFLKMQILIPDIFTKGIIEYRRYCGTTPLIRAAGAWQEFEYLLKEVRKRYNTRVVKCTTTKFIKDPSHQSAALKENDIFGENAFYRFMHHVPIFGTVEFDSESVIGDRYKWGLENKLSSIVFPIAYYLRAKQVYIAGFDFQGPRFYSDDERHPWSDESQANSVVEFPLRIIKKWLQWSRFHGMELFSIVDEKWSLLNKVIPHKKITDVYKEKQCLTHTKTR